MSKPRIVSLLPSATEIVCALGLGPNLVGRSHACDFPLEVRNIPSMTRPRVNVLKPSRTLHRSVVKLIEKVLSVFEVDAEKLRAARPDFIITQHQCEACAVTEKNLSDALAKWTGAKPTIISLAPTTLSEVWASFGTVGEMMDLGWAGRELAEQARERVEVIAERAPPLKDRPTVACVEWLDPPMIAGNWVPELVVAAGGRPVLAKRGEHAEQTTLGKIAEAAADAMILMPCGFDLERTMTEGREFLDRPSMAKTPAVRNNRVWSVDGNAYFNRPGPRLMTSVEILTEILNPGLFNAGYEGVGWQSMTGR